MRALITGATGLVGRHLVEYLLAKDYEVIAMGRNQEILAKLEQVGASTLQFDLTQPYSDFRELDNYANATWYHVAAAISGASQQTLDKVNVEGTQKLVNKAQELNIPGIVLVSSISTFGIGGEGNLTEESQQSPDSYYGWTKLEQERILKTSDLNFGIVRPPYIGGPFDENFLEEFASRIEQGKMPRFSKDGIISYVDARDLAQALHRVGEELGRGEYHVISDTISHAELIDLLGDKLDADPPYGPTYPYWFAMIVGFFGEIVAKLQGKSPARGISRYRIRTLCRQVVLDDSKIREELDYNPQYSVESSIDDWIKTRIAD